MKTITVNLYELSELTPEAKGKALDNWNRNNDMPMLQEDLTEWLRGALEEKGIEGEPEVFYSLAYCQGDGAMFAGSFFYKGVSVRINHRGHYYHSRCKEMDFDYEGLSDTDPLKTDLKMRDRFELEFDELYTRLCEQLEKVGYDQIEYEQSEASFTDACEANGYTFEQDGTMHNA